MGLQWLKAGWAIFRTQPVTFIFMYIFIVAVSLLAILGPLFQVAATLTGPFLSAGFYLAVINKQVNKPIKLADIFEPFGAKGRRLALVRVGIYQMGAAVLLSLAAAGLFSEVTTVMETAGENTDPSILLQNIVQSLSMADIALYVIIHSFIMMAFAYVVPLVFFQGEKRMFHAMKCSLNAFYHNMGALTVFGLVVALLLLASAPLSMIPAIIIMPVALIGFFVSYQAMFMPITLPGDKPESNNSKVDSGRFDA